jgi:hypothetical protein
MKRSFVGFDGVSSKPIRTNTLKKTTYLIKSIPSTGEPHFVYNAAGWGDVIKNDLLQSSEYD